MLQSYHVMAKPTGAKCNFVRGAQGLFHPRGLADEDHGGPIAARQYADGIMKILAEEEGRPTPGEEKNRA